MALVVFLRGVNVGGHKTFRPKQLAEQLKEYEAINIGAAGTFVVRRPITEVRLRAELRRLLPFETDAMICKGTEFLRVTSGDPFAFGPSTPDIVRFVSVMAAGTSVRPILPLVLPSDGDWLVKLVSRQGRFLFGIYRRHMHTIRYLSQIEKLIGASVTTRNWNTIMSIARVLHPD